MDAKTSVKIVYAGYGVYNSICDATTSVQNKYREGERVFVANNNYCGDPAPGARKYLYIVWEDRAGNLGSGVTGENDIKGVTVP